jgi:hypothetical protein
MIEPPEYLGRRQFGHASDVVRAALRAELAGRARERSTDRYDQWTARHPFVIRVASREQAQYPTPSHRREVRHARVVGDDIWRGVNGLYQLFPAQNAAGIHGPLRRQAANEVVRHGALPSRPNDHGREAMFTPNEPDELSVIASGPLPRALIRERRYDDSARFRAHHQSNSVA